MNRNIMLAATHLEYLKTVNNVLRSNIKQHNNAMTDFVMCTSYVSIYDCITSNLALSLLILTIHRISRPTS